MWGWIFLFLISFQAQAQDTFCIQTFNAYGPAYATALASRTERLVQEWNQKVPCSIIHLQEVWTENHFDLLETFRRFSWSHYRMDTYRRDRFRSGLSLMTDYKIDSISSRLFQINQDGALDWIRRKVGVAKAWGAARVFVYSQPIWILNVHLHHSSSSIRTAQILELLDWIERKTQGEPVILTGDFNALPDSPEHRLLRRVGRFIDSYQSVHPYTSQTCTYCDQNSLAWGRGNRVFDYIFFRPGEEWNLHPLSAAINLKGDHLGPYSDHYGVQTTFELYPEIQLPDDQDARKTALRTLQSARSRLRYEQEDRFIPAYQWIRNLERHWQNPSIATIN